MLSKLSHRSSTLLGEGRVSEAGRGASDADATDGVGQGFDRVAHSSGLLSGRVPATMVPRGPFCGSFGHGPVNGKCFSIGIPLEESCSTGSILRL